MADEALRDDASSAVLRGHRRSCHARARSVRRTGTGAPCFQRAAIRGSTVGLSFESLAWENFPVSVGSRSMFREASRLLAFCLGVAGAATGSSGGLLRESDRNESGASSDRKRAIRMVPLLRIV